MLRIFGLYSLGESYKDTVFRMKKIFEIKSRFTKFMTFNQSNTFLNYEMVNSEESKNFYFIDKNNQIACFITGNIYAYEKSQLGILQGKNIAKMVVTRYKENNLDSIKYFRGEFNIIIITKNQLFLINDILGLSPMYIYRIKEGFLFCNHAEPIIWLNKNNCIDYSSIAEFLVYGFVPNGKTFIRGLTNQPPGTIIQINKRKVLINRYIYFKSMDLKKVNQEQKLKLTKDLFNEAVKIRVNKERVFSELTGGWDTRFVLANLLELNEKVIIFTEKFCKEDVVIARKIVKKIKLEHIIYNLLKLTPGKVEDDNLKFELRKTVPDNNLAKIFNKGLNYLRNVEFFTLPKFTGLFGTEFLGYLPDWFLKRINLKFSVVASKIFTHHFLSRIYYEKTERSFFHFKILDNLSKYIYLFLTQIGRSYINVHYTRGWERPTHFFSYLYLNPFADSRFVSLLCSLEYNRDMYYRLYTKIYKRYYYDFLDISWTDMKYRIKNNLKKNLSQRRSFESDKKKFLRLITKDREFRIFLKTNQIVQKTKVAIFSRLKELYFIFKWLEAYKSVLRSSDLKFLLNTYSDANLF